VIDIIIMGGCLAVDFGGFLDSCVAYDYTEAEGQISTGGSIVMGQIYAWAHWLQRCDNLQCDLLGSLIATE
jgi:hypothetical protein